MNYLQERAAAMRLAAAVAGLMATLPLANAADVSDARISREGPRGENWFLNGGNFAGQHYSPLDQIDADNVATLGLAWATVVDAADGIAGTPIVVDDVIYLSAAYSIVYALDARTGRQIWRFDPQLRARLSANPGMSWLARANRGVAVYAGKVFVATADCMLLAIDARRGRQVWSVETCDTKQGFGISDAPRVGGGKVFIGNAGSESGEKNRGYVSAYDVDDGGLLWRFYTVPSSDPAENTSAAMKMAAETWSGDALQKFGGGGSAWNEMTYDPVADLLYFGTAGAIPYLHHERSPDGLDNLFLSSVLAVDASTGEYRWHYQTVPEENWDYNANMNIVLAELNINGKRRDTLMIAPKNGFFYVLDRLTGELLSAEKYATVNWASHINMETGRPVLLDSGKFWTLPVGEKTAIWPNMWGAHSWNPMAYHPGTRLVYIPVIDTPSVVWMHDDGSYSDTVELVTIRDGKPHAPGRLTAWDPVAQRPAWSVEHALPFNGGVLATAGGVVFQGTAGGDFSAYDAVTGERYWNVYTGSAINSAPVSFLSDGQQVILLAVGAGGGMQFVYPELHAAEGLRGPTRVMAFSLDGESTLGDGVFPAPPLPELPSADITPEITAYGDELYHDHCASCHGKHARARAGGTVPDLRYATLKTHAEWPAIVIGGAREAAGMPRSDISADDAAAIRLYVLQRARLLQDES